MQTDIKPLNGNSTGMGKNADWTVPAIILVLAQHIAALFISNALGFNERPPTLSYMLMALVLSVLGGLALLLHKLWCLWREAETRPVSRLVRAARFRTIATYMLGFQLVALQMAALTWLKDMLPWVVPFWADVALAELDRMVLGTDTWRLVPAAFVTPLDILYPTWGILKFSATLLILARPASEIKSHAMLAYFLTVGVVGVVGQYLLPSAGPIFYDRLVPGNQFGELTVRLGQLAPIAHAASEYLWNSYLQDDNGIGTGISAMPSIHVATTTWVALAMSRVWPKSALPLWSFWLMILVGSVGLGWHYLSDGIVGAAGAVICWRLSPVLLARLGTAHERRQSVGAVRPI